VIVEQLGHRRRVGQVDLLEPGRPAAETADGVIAAGELFDRSSAMTTSKPRSRRLVLV
jgi:hypothetical protein